MSMNRVLNFTTTISPDVYRPKKQPKPLRGTVNNSLTKAFAVLMLLVLVIGCSVIYQYIYIRSNTISGTPISVKDLVRTVRTSPLQVSMLTVAAKTTQNIRNSATHPSTSKDTLPTTESISSSPAITSKIPLVIYQTYNFKNLIPPKVEANFHKFAPQYKRTIYNDSECAEFIKTHFHSSVLQTYMHLKGAHRADLFRYAILYIHGGVYMDIKTELLTPLIAIVPTETKRIEHNEKVEATMFTVLSGGPWQRSVFQGVIGSPQGNPLFLHLIQDFVQSKKPIPDYSQSVKMMYEMIAKETKQDLLRGGLNVGKADGDTATLPQQQSQPPSQPPRQQQQQQSGKGLRFSYYLYEEKERPVEECYDGADKYNSCYFIYKGGERIMKTRYADYPWHATPNNTRTRRFPIILNLNQFITPLIS